MNPLHSMAISSIAGALIVTSLLLTTACSSKDQPEAGSKGRSSEPEATSSTTTAPAPSDGVASTPQPSAKAVVGRMLELLEAGDGEGSYRLLDEAGRRSYASLAAWERRQESAAPIADFEIERAEGDRVVVLVSHEPALDPFQGLVPARERQTWSAVEVAGGWLVGAQPTTEFLLPSDDEAASAAVAWARDVQGCREDAARKRQAVEILFSASTSLPTVCGVRGDVVAGPVANLDAGPVSADLVAQYSSDALSWARVVPITIGDVQLSLTMAPIGDSWEVVGVSD